MLKNEERQRNVIFNVIQTLNDEFKRANITARYAFGDSAVLITMWTNGKRMRGNLIDTTDLRTYQELFAKVYKILRNTIIQYIVFTRNYDFI